MNIEKVNDPFIIRERDKKRRRLKENASEDIIKQIVESAKLEKKASSITILKIQRDKPYTLFQIIEEIQNMGYKPGNSAELMNCEIKKLSSGILLLITPSIWTFYNKKYVLARIGEVPKFINDEGIKNLDKKLELYFLATKKTTKTS